MDATALHATLQFPVTIVMFLIGIMMLMRWQALSRGESSRADRRVVCKLGLIFVALALKQAYWAIEGSLRANGLDGAAGAMRASPHVATALNAAIILVGLMVIARVATGFIGPRAYAAVIASGLAMTAIGATLAMTGKGP